MSFHRQVLQCFQRENSTVSWGVVLHSDHGISFALDPDKELWTASCAKLMLLAVVSYDIEQGFLHEDQLISKSDISVIVGQAGIWQHLEVETLSIGDLCQLVGAYSDNLATNGLIQVVGGPESLNSKAAKLGISGIRILDYVRDQRSPSHANTFSIGTANSYLELMQCLRGEGLLGKRVGSRVIRWASNNADVTLVLEPFALDPLFRSATTPLLAINKTGSDLGVCVDVGYVEFDSEVIDYAVIANWRDEEEANLARLSVIESMRNLGKLLADMASERLAL